MSELCIGLVSTNRWKYSETFIHRQIRELPGKVLLLTDGYLPTAYSSDRGQSFQDIPKPGWWKSKPKSWTETPWALHELLRKQKVQVVLAHFGPSGVEVAPVCKALNIPLVVHFHGYDAFRQDVLGSYGKAYRDLFRVAAKVISVSTPMTQQLKELGCPENRIVQLLHGIDTSIFQASARPNNFQLIACGRFVPKKAPLKLIHGFAAIVQELPESTLVFAGDGPLKAEAEQLARDLNLQDRITFTGAIDQQELARLMKESQIFLQHSEQATDGDTEGAPLTVLEAGSCGLPVVATRHAGIPEIVIHEETGLLVAPGDHHAMATAALQILRDSALATRLGQQGAQRVRELHDPQKHITRIHRLLHEVL